MFGWRPKPSKVEITPIPLCFARVEYNFHDVIDNERVLYLGPRPQTSIQVHDKFANKTTFLQ